MLSIRGLKTCYMVRKTFSSFNAGRITAVNRVSLDLHRGETLGLVGESGCGKSTLARSIIRLEKPTEGEMRIRLDGAMKEIGKLSPRELPGFHRTIQFVFQDPFSALNPRMTIHEAIREPLVIQRLEKEMDARKLVRGLMEKVGIPSSFSDRYPHALSGGQRQRVVIARALALSPEILIADEPVSALDISVQAQILNLLNDLKKNLNLTYLFISHNLDVVKYMSDRIGVMYMGSIVEMGEADAIYQTPLHPYTESLLSAIPRLRQRGAERRERIILKGDVPDLFHPPAGCAFSARCPYARDLCRDSSPALLPIVEGHSAACHFASELKLGGAS